ncbi:filamentous hemagglutinin N-terminal domain-containing protein [Pararhizobium sp.]|uniref:filamentous hemagglutinin N-terminal domain-containing protein n=1 Tax=Pararhizobium sp. TaxID=1977563 RepID=UPI00271D8A4B|nr:filamentous hemagglutinin N-terminal domain-containing protein [Pararhizobium sp.]MDO9415816.1 filamentous hemagglutinin N-terminal domain-containing protein [Pararhizobium sp.]
MTGTASTIVKLRAALLAGAALTATAWSVEAQVIPDGGTLTSETTDASGVTTVVIAPPDSSQISYNTYTDFSVPTAGVNLDNESHVARTILNEVTSARLSRLNGPLTVLGNAAHVIIVNPNGISVDGGSFVNTGGVVLSTGKASFKAYTTPLGHSQNNVVLETTGGRIDVTGAGLSGAMENLQLLAAEIRIDGPVETTSASERSQILLQAGGSRVEYDSAIAPNASLQSWGKVEAVPGVAGDAAVEITGRGSLKANTVRILATDQGAGVTHAGEGLASGGDFLIDASGKVSITGKIKAAHNVSVKGSSIEAGSATGKAQTTVEAISGALTLIAATGDITNTGVLMSGNVRDENNNASKGGATLVAAGDISLLSEQADQLAIVYSSTGDLDVVAGGSVVNNTGRLLANGKTRIVAGGDILNTIDIVAGASPMGVWTHVEKVGKRLWYTAWQKRTVTTSASIDYGRERVPGKPAYIVGSDVTLNAGGRVANTGGTIIANSDEPGAGGDVTINAAAIDNTALVSGSLSFMQTCKLFCVGYGTSDMALVGGTISGNGNMSLTAAGTILNAGQISSYGAMNLAAREVVIKGTRVTSVYQRPPGLYNFWRGSTVWMGEMDAGGVLAAPVGGIKIDAFKPVVVDAGLLEARDGVTVPGGIDLIRAPLSGLTTAKRQIGLFNHLTGK